METIVRYTNRKLYSKTLSKYVTLKYIKDLIKTDQQFQVVAHNTKLNLTEKTIQDVLGNVMIPKTTMIELIKNG